MNANELADELDWMTPEKLVGWCNSVQAMLRQQQAEIEALKAHPVAWMLTLPDGTHDWILDGNGCEGYIPLYTHPVKELSNPVAWRSQDPDGYWSVYQAPVENAEPLYTGFKELTDFEILNISCGYPDRLNFARAILRKAQEK